MAKKIWLSLAHMGGHEQRFVQDAFDSNWVVPLGPNLDGFEKDIENFIGGGKFVVGLSSGTAAIHLALLLLNVQQGDDVICQSFTFSASANPIVYLGANPIFVDSEPDTWNLSPECLEEAILRVITLKGRPPKAIIAVHLYGMPFNIGRIVPIAKKYGVPIVEDAAEAMGSEYDGKKCGTFGEFGILSFNGNKIITTSGGGAIICNSKQIAERVKFYATQAREDKPFYYHTKIGFNYRMSNICAGIGRGQMMVLDEHIERRKSIHKMYSALLSDIEGVEVKQSADPIYNSNFWLTCILISKKILGKTPLEVMQELSSREIESRLLWRPMHMQPVFQSASYFGTNVSEKIFNEGLCLPSGSSLLDSDIECVVDSLKEIFRAK